MRVGFFFCSFIDSCHYRKGVKGHSAFECALGFLILVLSTIFILNRASAFVSCLETNLASFLSDCEFAVVLTQLKMTHLSFRVFTLEIQFDPLLACQPGSRTVVLLPLSRCQYAKNWKNYS